jgi:cytidylate kinase
VVEYGARFAAVTVGLFQKALISVREGRPQHRSTLQHETIVTEISAKEWNVCRRFEGFFAVEDPPDWDNRREMGLAFLTLGATRTTAQIFAEHAMWEELA